MINFISKTVNLALASILALAFLGLEANAVEYWLSAGTTTLTMPDGEVIQMWGYGEDTDQDLSTVEGNYSVPGPELKVPAGDTTLTIHLRNDLPVPSSLMIAGQPADGTAPTYSGGRVLSFNDEAGANGGTVTYTWANVRPGTFLYTSATNPAVQVQMGLYGAMVAVLEDGPLCGPAPGGGTAYPGIIFDEDLTLLFSEIDPALHEAVAADDYGPGKAITSTVNYRPLYFLINGVAKEAGSNPIEIGSGGDRLLIRFLNAGLETAMPVIQGFYMQLVADDGFPMPFPSEQYSVMLTAGKTHDAIFSLLCDSLPEPISSTGTFAVFDRRAHRLTNNNAAGDGGMMTEFTLLDQDGESIVDICDNCLGVANPAQVDTDGDLFGNFCDTDLNNDLYADFGDVPLMVRAFIWQEEAGDFNSDGSVNFYDIARFLDLFNTTPGPSGQSNANHF
ncbi:MAG: multicopper oxidase domain-containing protein [Myxococcota bacterium]|nr:multicopper oxidase domain-containing protein [Myxococcota bacterium]